MKDIGTLAAAGRSEAAGAEPETDEVMGEPAYGDSKVLSSGGVHARGIDRQRTLGQKSEHYHLQYPINQQIALQYPRLSEYCGGGVGQRSQEKRMECRVPEGIQRRG